MESEVVPFCINQSIDRSAYYFIIKSTPSVINLAVLESVPVQGNRLMCPQFLQEMLKSFGITTVEVITIDFENVFSYCVVKLIFPVMSSSLTNLHIHRNPSFVNSV